jgi:hypothetical protein
MDWPRIDHHVRRLHITMRDATIARRATAISYGDGDFEQVAHRQPAHAE